MLLGCGLYGAFLVGRAQRAPEIASAIPDQFADLRKQLGDFSSDGRVGTRCGATKDAVCQIPIGRLIATPEAFHGKTILTTGLLAYGPLGVMLYPSEASVRFELGDGIWLVEVPNLPQQPAPVVPEALWSRLEKGVWVSLVGTFDLGYVGQRPNIGALRNVHYVEELRDYLYRDPSPTPKLKSISPVPESSPQSETLPAKP
jgi:hypothetical protein